MRFIPDSNGLHARLRCPATFSGNLDMTVVICNLYDDSSAAPRPRAAKNRSPRSCCACVITSHCPSHQTAVIFEEDGGNVRHISYRELHGEVCRVTNLLRSWGVRKGDTVAIYLPMIPEIGARACVCGEG